MASLRKILAKARGNPKSISFAELLKLTIAVGFVERKTSSSGKKQGGSHKKFSHPDYPGVLMNYQKHNTKKKMAKDYQVEQFLSFLDDFSQAEEKIQNGK